MLCDSVARDAISGRATVVGVFQTVELKPFPATTEPFSIWLQLTDGHGRVAMKLVIERVPPDDLECETILRIPFSLKFDNPNLVQEHEAVLRDGLGLEHEGHYRVRLTANETTIQQRYFVARKLRGGET